MTKNVFFEVPQKYMYYSVTRKTMNTWNISGMLLCSTKKANKVWEN